MLLEKVIFAIVLLFIYCLVSAKSQGVSNANQPVESIGRCQTPRNESGQCINIFDCSELLNLIQANIENENNRKLLSDSFCGYHQNKIMVCCPRITVSQMPLATLDRTTPISSPLLPQPGVCGNGAICNRVVGGNISCIDEFPWMALLRYDRVENLRNKNAGFNCEGALINNRYVITAAHCVENLPRRLVLSSVRLGEFDTTKEIDCDSDGYCINSPIDVDIEEIIPHPEYLTSSYQHNDIALLRLSQSINFTDTIQPICLPISNYLKTTNFIDRTVQIAGWGRTEYSASSSVKIKANLKIRNFDDCKDVYQKLRMRIINEQICAGGDFNIDSCQGDSGGPLMLEDRSSSNNQPFHYVIGITSFGPKICGQEGVPAVYTKVSSYMNWIISQIRP